MAVLLRAGAFLLLFFSLVHVSYGFSIFDLDPFTIEPPERKYEYETEYRGGWELVSLNSGVSAMHLQLMPLTDKAIMFDSTVYGPSQMPLPFGNCRFDPSNKGTHEDCWAHAVEFDVHSSLVRPLKILTDTWCSSGSLAPNGTLVQTGGWNTGGRGVRYLTSCPTCDWLEFPTSLSVQRWYATQQILPDGSNILVGGRRQFSYEYVPKPGQSNPTNFKLPFLRETTDDVENNLYPFVYLSTDGNVFIFANNRSILLNPKTNTVVREFPVLPEASRNYPASAMSVLLPIKLRGGNQKSLPAQVLICGGAKSENARRAGKGVFLPASRTCGRLTITNPNPIWSIEVMPTPRVMGDMLLLPTGDVLLINGAKMGSAGWGFATEPNFEPMIYSPKKKRTERFTRLQPTTIPRMYHSTSAVLPDGRILVAGSNPNSGYNFTGVPFPTELRVEKFWPPYLDPLLAVHRPQILPTFLGKTLSYGQSFSIQIYLAKMDLGVSDIKVTMYAPPFTTHGISMNQRMIVLRTLNVNMVGLATFDISTEAPPMAVIAPPGYYLLFVVHLGLPSKGVWIRM
ncbi:glyoxal oxidase-related protein [Tasmannia lanceolata]|uniref:glyoxal oxidase-related protein n=1 Tax=Tasmannia lanceolata TaxID=3420 RepID=UPI004062F982